MYVASFDASAVDVFSRNTSTGALTYSDCIGEEKGCASTTPARALEGADSVAVSPDGASAYVGAQESLDVFERNTSTGALTYKQCIGELPGCTSTSPAEAVVGVSSVTVSRDGHSVYATNRSFGMLDFFEREAGTGVLTLESCLGDSGSKCAYSLPNKALESAGSVMASADGLSVYVASNGLPSAGGLVAFTRDPSTGKLIYQGCFGQAGGCTATSPLNAVEKDYSVAVSPNGANVYTASEGPNAVGVFSRSTSTGALSYEGCIGNDSEAGCTATSPADALDDADSVVVSPDGSDLYASSGATLSSFSLPAPACSSCSTALTPGEAAATSQPSSIKYTPKPPSPQSTLATLGNQRITLITPSPLSCTASAGKLLVNLNSSAITGSRASKLKFTRATFFLGNGIRHTRRTTTDLRGHRNTTIAVTYSPNATISRLPAKLELSLAGLKPGSHILSVKLLYRQSRRRHGRVLTTTFVKTLSARVTVC